MSESIRKTHYFRPTPSTNPSVHNTVSRSRSPSIQPRMGTRVAFTSPVTDTTSARLVNTSKIPPSPPITTSAAKRLRRNSANRTAKLERVVDWPQFRLRRRPTTTRGTKVSIPTTATVTSRLPVKAVHPDSFVTSDERSVTAVGTTKVTSAYPFDATHCIGSLGLISPVRIATNPHVRRRYSAEEGIAHAIEQEPPAVNQFPFERLSDTEPLSSDLQNKSISATAPSTQTDQIPRWMSQPLGESINRTKSTGRYSAEAVLRSHKSDPSLVPHLPRQRRRSSFFLEIKRSARETLNSLRKVLRGSTNSLQEAVEMDRPVLENVDQNILNQSIPSDRRYSRRLSSSCDTVALQPRADQKRTIRHITLSRNDATQPFGLYVVKSELGFQITRLSEQVCAAPQNILACGDELLRVNGVDCKNLSVEAVRQLFRQSRELLLTVLIVNK